MGSAKSIKVACGRARQAFSSASLNLQAPSPSPSFSSRLMGLPGTSDRQLVAIKLLNLLGEQGRREFLVETLMLVVLDHPNLVKLIGYCAEGDQRLLVYEFMPRGSLESHIHGKHQPISEEISAVRRDRRLKIHFSILHISINFSRSSDRKRGAGVGCEGKDSPRHGERALVLAPHNGPIHHTSRYEVCKHPAGRGVQSEGL